MDNTATDFLCSIFFDQSYYLAEKAAAMTAQTGKIWSSADVYTAITKAGMTPFEHYARYGAKERTADGDLGLDPSKLFSTHDYYTDWSWQSGKSVSTIAGSLKTDPITDYATRGFSNGISASCVDDALFTHASRVSAYKDFYFNEEEYLTNKTDALNANGGNWTVAKTAKAIADAKMTPWQHFTHYGAFETNADGELGINPSKYFDVSRYYEDKASSLQSTKESVCTDFKAKHIDPITHYAQYGYLEHISPVATDCTAINGSETHQTVPLSGNVLIDSLLMDSWSSWPNLNAVGYSQNNTIYYHLPTQTELSSFNLPHPSRPLTQTQKQGYLQGLAELNAITGIRFQETSDIAKADLLFFQEADQGNGRSINLGWTEVDASRYGRNVQAVILNDSSVISQNGNPTFGNEAFETVLHELGHAMGLTHSFSTDGINLAVLPEALDNTAWSIMSYSVANEIGAEQWYHNGKQYYSPFDILALHYLYGTDGLNGQEGITYDPIMPNPA